MKIGMQFAMPVEPENYFPEDDEIEFTALSESNDTGTILYATLTVPRSSSPGSSTRLWQRRS